MQTEIHLIGGQTASYDETVDIKMTNHGVEITQPGEEETVRVLYPWAQILKVTQRGKQLHSVYTY
jgi:hypothetical protein